MWACFSVQIVYVRAYMYEVCTYVLVLIVAVMKSPCMVTHDNACHASMPDTPHDAKMPS